MLRMELCVVILIVFGATVPCFGQTFDGTYLSSDKPFYAKNPYVFEGSENYAITFYSKPEVIRKLVPEPLVPMSNGQIVFIYSKHRLKHPLNVDYNEAYLIVPVSYGTTIGGYIPVLYLDTVDGIIAGRELVGYNKVGADFEVVENETGISVSVSQKGTLIIKATFTLGEAFTPTQASPSLPVINYKYIPSFVQNSQPDVKCLTISKAKNQETTRMRAGTATLEFHSSKFNPLGEIPILKIEKAGYTQDSFTLTYGNILYDYLEENK